MLHCNFFDNHWALSQAWTSLIDDVGWSSTSSSSSFSSFKSKPKWLYQPVPKSINSVMLYIASTIYSPSNCTYFTIGISTYPRFKDCEMRLANAFEVFYFFSLISHIILHGIIGTPCKILDILQLFRMIQWVLRATHNSVPYIRHYFPQVSVSSDYAPKSPHNLACISKAQRMFWNKALKQLTLVKLC